MSNIDPIFFLEKAFVLVYTFDKECYRYYDYKIIRDYPNFENIMKSYITKNYERLSSEPDDSEYDDCNYDNSHYISRLQLNITNNKIDIPDDFMKRMRSMGLRYSAGNVAYVMSSENSASYRDILILSKNLDLLVDSINMEDPYSIETVIEICENFPKNKYSYKKIKDYAYKFKEDALTPKRYLSMYKTHPILFAYICKSIIKDENIEDANRLPDLLRSMYKNSDFTEYVASHAESIWSYFNFEEYVEARFSKVKTFDYKKRAIVYAAVIFSGKANRSIARSVRSDGSKFTSSFGTQCILSSKDMYDINTWKGMLSQLCDSNFIEVVRILERKLPKDLIPFLVGNKLSNKRIIAKRMSE